MKTNITDNRTESVLTVRNRLIRPIFSWLTGKLALPFWKRSFIDPLEVLTR